MQLCVLIVYLDDFLSHVLYSHHEKRVTLFSTSSWECDMQEMIERVQEVFWSCRNYLREWNKKPSIPRKTVPVVTVAAFLNLFQLGV